MDKNWEIEFNNCLIANSPAGFSQFYRLRIESLAPRSKGYWYYDPMDGDFKEILGFIGKYYSDMFPVYGKILSFNNLLKDHRDDYYFCLARIPRESHKDYYKYKVLFSK